MKRMIIWTVLIVAVVGGIIGYSMYTKETADVVNQEPDLKVDANTLIADFQKDTAAASKKYIDKVIELTGMLKKIDTTGTLIFGSEGDPSEVVVGLDRRHMDDHKTLTVGKQATVQGICSGYSASGGNSDDLLANLGTTVEFKTAGVKNK